MSKYLLDTNVILRFSNKVDSQHELVVEAIATLLRQGNECYLAPQVIIEMWTVATRPTDVNGLGWSANKTRGEIDQLLNVFAIVEETPQILPTWLSLVTENKVCGKRTHDARLAALMETSNISYILTLNPKDFTGFLIIRAIHPKEIVKGNVGK